MEFDISVAVLQYNVFPLKYYFSFFPFHIVWVRFCKLLYHFLNRSASVLKSVLSRSYKKWCFTELTYGRSQVLTNDEKFSTPLISCQDFKFVLTWPNNQCTFNQEHTTNTHTHTNKQTHKQTHKQTQIQTHINTHKYKHT